MAFDTPPEAEDVRQALEKAKQEAQAAQKVVREKEEDLGADMLTHMQKVMNSGHRDDATNIETELMLLGLSMEDLNRIQLHFEGAREDNQITTRVLKGKIIGIKNKENPSESKKDHTIEIQFRWNDKQINSAWNPEHIALEAGEAFVDGEPVSQEVADKILKKYFHIARLQEQIEARDKSYEQPLAEEKRLAQIERDLDL